MTKSNATDAFDVESRVLVLKPLLVKKTPAPITMSTTTKIDPRVIVPVLPPKPSPIPSPNGTVTGGTEYEVCAPYPACNPIGCDDPTVAPIDCESCNRAATGGAIFGMTVLAFLIITANLLVVRTILRTPSLRRRHGYIKLSMATSDLLVGIFIIPSAIANLIMTLYSPYRDPDTYDGEPIDMEAQIEEIGQRNSIASIIFGTIAVTSVTSSLYNLLLLSFDRFLAIARPLKHRVGRYSPKSLWLSIAAVWLFGVTLSVVPAFFPHYFSYGMDITTFFYVQFVTSPDVSEGDGYGFSPYYITIIIGAPYFLTVLLNVLTTVFTWRSLRVRSRLSTRNLSKSAMEKKCERNKRLRMLRKAYPEDMEETSTSTFKSMLKGTPRNKAKKNRNGMSTSKEKHSWLNRWHSEEDSPNKNASNNVSTDSEKSQNSQSPRFQRTRDQLHIVRDNKTLTNIRKKAKDFQEKHRTHVRVLKMIIAMVISFSVCLLPYVIVSAKMSNGSLDCSNVAVPFSFALYMLFINSGMNFVIYNFFHPEFRHHLKKTFVADYSKTSSWRHAASSLFMTSHKNTDSHSRTTATSVDVLDEK